MISADSGLSKASHEPTLTPPAFNLFLTLFSRTPQSLRLLGPFLVAACASVAAAASLPAPLAPPPPFPQIVAQSEETEFVAPGVTRADYRLATKVGPLAVEVVTVDLRQPSTRLGSVVAADHLISDGETISSMAQRTHAVAGVNADYFDIGQTNQPLNIVVQNGTLLRTPSSRVALDVGRDRTVHFENFTFTGSVQLPGGTVPLESVNVWPPQHGAVLLTRAFGALPQPTDDTQNISLVSLAALGAPDQIAGNYRVLGVYSPMAGPIGAPTLALGPGALAAVPPPVAGDVVTIAAQTDPPLQEIASAVGGGPLLVFGGKPFVDPNSPAPEETNRRFPLSGAALTPDGKLLLVAVDGREPDASVGLTRPEFGALMRGLGATEGMAFDSGGSSTLVARRLGDATATVLNSPSDGTERPVADGVFIYSDAPVGPPARLALHPAQIEAVRGAHVRVTAAIVDAAGHPLGPAPGLTIDALRSQTVVVRHAGLVAELPVRVIDRVAHLRIEPVRPNPDPGGIVQLQAQGTDASGRVVATDGAVRWNADGGTFIEPGLYRAGARNATVVASVAEMSVQKSVAVGRHEVRMPWFGPDGVNLDYDFTGANRFAFHNATYPLPGDPLSFSIDVNGDGSGVALRAAFRNRFGERTAITLAKRVDWHGWQRRTIALPGLLNPPITLVSLYAVNSLGTPPVHAAGTIGLRDPAVILPGTQ
ncbi:MAG: phosphodiester glycosidase family protein [Vulcanimicrobiaceae bacterium]